MNARQRHLETILFGRPDRVPLDPGWGRRSTRARWHEEGLPEGVDPNEYAYRQAGGTLPWPQGGEGFHVDERLRPRFEEKVLERLPNSQIVQDWKGNVCEIGLEFDVTYLRNAIDFVTRRWIRCPVENRSDWEVMRGRYLPDDSARLPENPEALGNRLRQRDHLLLWSFSGPFWQLREWLGFEKLCEVFLDDPEWVREMVFFWQEYIAQLLENAFRHVVPDHIHFSEDMAYKAHPMIGPDMTREFLLPCYKRWGSLLRDYRVPIYGIDSDGDITTLLPVYREAGVQLVDPMEVAAGIDLPALRTVYGQTMAFRGGIDKRCIAAGGRFIEREIDRLRPVITSGGYIPGCDHGVPADVSWPHYLHYVELLAQATGWLD